MLTLYKILMNLLYVAIWPYMRIKQFESGVEWQQRRVLSPDTYLPKNEKGIIWLHASSVGEVRGLERLLASLKKKKPNLSYVVSTYTTTGQQLAKQLFTDARAIFFFPLDCYFPLRRLFSVFRPSGVIIVETEIWPYFLSFCRKKDISVILANGRLSQKSTARYRYFGNALRTMLLAYKRFIMQSEADAERIIVLGAEKSRTTVLGNLKYDADNSGNWLSKRQEIRKRFSLSNEDVFFIAASTRPGEEEVILRALQNGTSFTERMKVLIAPRHLERLDEVQALLRRYRFSTCLYSDSSSIGDNHVILMDKMGILRELFYGADIAFVGGTFADIGGHNVMEPVLAGTPVLFGPSTYNVADVAKTIVENSWGMQVQSAEDLAITLDKFASGKQAFAGYTPSVISVSDETADIIIEEFRL